MQDYVHYRYMNVALGIQDGTQSKCAIEQWRNREWCVYIWLDSVLIDHIDTTMQYGYIYIQLALGNARSNIIKLWWVKLYHNKEMLRTQIRSTGTTLTLK